MTILRLIGNDDEQRSMVVGVPKFLKNASVLSILLARKFHVCTYTYIGVNLI